MNAAAKVMSQTRIFQGDYKALSASVSLRILFILIALFFVSAISVVYVTHLNRVTYSQLEQAQYKAHQLQLQWGKLLLEQASLEAPARVQRISEKKLHMHLPQKKVTLHLNSSST